jgi:hypothetical protein
MTVVEKGKRISLRASWSSSGVASSKFGKSGCAYGWVEIGTPFSSRFTFSNSDKYFHTHILDMMIECMCLWLILAVFEQLLEILIFIM